MVNYTKRSVNSISISENMINEGSNFANVVESSLGSRDYDLYTYINKDEFSGGKQSCYYRIKVSPQKKSIEVWYNVSGRYGHPAEGISDSNYFENIDYLGVYTKK